MAGKKTPHMRDLFVTGQEVTISAFNEGEAIEIPLWFHVPSPLEKQEAQRIGRTAKARERLRHTKGDLKESSEQEVEIMDKDTLAATLITFTMNDIRAKSENEVMFHEDFGDNWSDKENEAGEEGRDIYSLTEAHAHRWAELADLNKEREEEEQDPIMYTEDKELTLIQDQIDEFREQVDVRIEEIRQVEMKRLLKERRSTLERNTLQRLIETQADLEFFQSYQLRMLWESCREPEDHAAHYFSSPEEIMEMPQTIRTQLNAAYDAMEMGVEDIKNWVSLLNSSN